MSENLNDYVNHIQQFKRCFNKDISYWRNYSLYGPANPKKQNVLNPDQIHECKNTPTGVCHMLTCKCLVEDSDDIKGNDWYTGYCLECEKQIENRSSAWRSPNLNGSFHDDCFCSYEHMELQFLKGENDDNIPLVEVMKTIYDKFPICMFEKHQGDDENDDYDNFDI